MNFAASTMLFGNDSLPIVTSFRSGKPLCSNVLAILFKADFSPFSFIKVTILYGANDNVVSAQLAMLEERTKHLQG
jgi:hypothetical protein